MESKKINQLATELTPALSDLTIIGDPTTGISKKITLSQMANLFTGTVEEYPNLASFPLVGTGDTIYIALDTNILYRWDTTLTSYVELSPNIVTSLVFNDANGFDGTISLVGSTATLTITTALTQGSVGFIGTLGALTQDNSNFFWDNTNKRLGINTNAPTTAIDAFGSGIIGRLNGTSTNNAFLGFASAGTNKWSIGNVQSDHRFRIYNEATTSELFTVLQTGEVGIGIANPLTKVHIDGGSTALIANLDANVSVAKSISFRSDNSNRINLEVSGTESGSNAGANFFIRRYSDAGALIDTPFTITRSTGLISLATDLSATTATFSGKITSTLGNNSVILENTTATTGWIQPIRILNTGGHLGIWVEGSSPNNRITGSSAYSSGIATYTNTDLHFGTNNALRMTISSTGNIGVGVAPSNWSGMLGLDIGTNAGIANFTDYALVTTNTFFNSGWFRKVDGFAASIFLRRDEGSIWFNTSANGAAGSSISAINTRMVITNDGKIGIGTNSPSERLDVVGGALAAGNGTIRTGITYSSIGLIGTYTNHDLGIITNGIERVRITTSGNVGIGTTAPVGKFDVALLNTRRFIVNYDDSIITIKGSSDTGSGENLRIIGDNIYFNSSSTGSGVERMRISSEGTVLFGRTSTFGSAYKAGFQEAIFMQVNANGNNMVNFFNASNSYIASIVINASTVSYGTGSDYRLKEDLKDFDGLNLLSKIKFYDFKFKEEGDRMTGVIAHELQEIVPYAVSGQKDEVDEEGNNKIQNVDYSKLVAIQGRAIQQLEARIKQLESK